MTKKTTKTTKKAPKSAELTPKQARFIKEYMIDLNGAQAAIRAGYSKNGARVTASKLLSKANIARALEAEFAEVKKRIDVDVDYVLHGLIELVERCLQRRPVMDFNYQTKEMEQRTDENGEGVWMFDSTGANKALRSLGDHLGMFKKVLAGDPDMPLFPNINITRATKPTPDSKSKGN